MEDRKADFLIAAYKEHKSEIAARRRTEIITTVLTMLFYAGCTAFVCLNDSASGMLAGLHVRAIVSIVLVLFANVICYFQFKNYKRHCELHRTIADLDKAFGFFQDGAYLPNRSLYPEDWQFSGKYREASMYGRVMITLAFTLVAVVAVWACSSI